MLNSVLLLQFSLPLSGHKFCQYIIHNMSPSLLPKHFSSVPTKMKKVPISNYTKTIIPLSSVNIIQQYYLHLR